MFTTRFSRSLAIIAMVLFVGCADEYRDWAFVQSAGGMSVGVPYRTVKGVMLPISVDVSGLKAITTKPATMNSALALKKVVVRQEGNTIHLGLVTTLATKSHRQTSSSDLMLGNLQSGHYTVVYAEPKGARIYVGAIDVAP